MGHRDTRDTGIQAGIHGIQGIHSIQGYMRDTWDTGIHEIRGYRNTWDGYMRYMGYRDT